MSPAGKSTKKHIGFVELPDEALDLFGHYAQRPDWEVVVVVSVDAQSYAARMAEVLRVPLLDRPNRPALVPCDRLIVGKRAGLVAMVKELVEDTPIEVVTLDAALAEMNADRQKQAAREASPARRRTAKTGPAASPAAAPAPGASAPGGNTPAPPAAKPAARPARPHSRPAPPDTPQPSETPLPNYTSASSFDAGTLLGVDFREKMGAISIDKNGDKMLHEILKLAVRVTRADSGSIMLVDDGGSHLRIAVASGLPQWVLDNTRQKVGAGIAGSVFATGKPRLLQGSVQGSQSPATEVRSGIRSAACVPIPAKGGPIGVLNVSVESEKIRFDEGTIALLNLFAREASGAVIKALNLKRLSGSAHRDAILRQIERLMSLQESLPARMRSVAEVLSQNLGADYAHCFVSDAEGEHLVLFGAPQGVAAPSGRSVPMDRGFLSWILRHGQSHVMEAVDKATGERAAMAYLPVRCHRPYAVLILERVPLREASSGQLLTFLAEIQEILEAYASLEIGSPDSRRSA